MNLHGLEKSNTYQKTKPIIPTIRDMILHNRCLENKEEEEKINENETKKNRFKMKNNDEVRF